MTNTTKSIISPSDNLILSLEVGQVPIPILQTLFSELPVYKQRVKNIHAITDMLLATENLDLWVELYEEYFTPPARLKKADALASLKPVTPRKSWN